jgi:eukaryotic-like serine/threonine-protein kinase
VREPTTPNTLSAGQRAAPGFVIGGRYSLRTAIGHGGMGTVWRATDTILRRDVAVKEVILPPGMAPADRDSMYQRTLREARAAAALSHPAVVQVYDVVTEAGRPWIIMELLQARSLAEMIVEDGAFAPRAVAKIGIALLGALEVAHAAGVLHRDVKPANVLICGDGRCVLTDFGVARMPTDAELTTPGMVLGSPHFISPERAIGAKFGPPSDLFSLGVTLYTAVEGRPPFDKSDPFETMRAVVEEPPQQAMRAGPLAGVLYGLLEKDPARRWTVETARAVLRDLMVGPLASNAPAHVTDPYAVVRPTPYQAPPAPAQQPTGQIGGRAMMAPGETVSSAIKRLHQDSPPTGRPGQPGQPDPELERTDGGSTPTAAFVGGRFAAPPAQGGAYGGDWVQPTPPPPHGHGRGPGLGANLKSTLVGGGRRAVTVAKGAPRWAQIAGAAALALVLFLIIGAVSGLFGSGGDQKAGPSPTAHATGAPTFKTEAFHDPRGITVDVPTTWTKDTTSSYTDFFDPDDHNSKLRVNVEGSGTSARSYLEVSEQRLQKNLSPCAAPYTRVDLKDLTLDGKPAAQLEYTCGSGDQKRHAIFGAIVVNKKSYYFFLSVPEARFAQSKPIYDQVVKSVKVTPGQ